MACLAEGVGLDSTAPSSPATSPLLLLTLRGALPQAGPEVAPLASHRLHIPFGQEDLIRDVPQSSETEAPEPGNQRFPSDVDCASDWLSPCQQSTAVYKTVDSAGKKLTKSINTCYVLLQLGQRITLHVLSCHSTCPTQ